MSGILPSCTVCFHSRMDMSASLMKIFILMGQSNMTGIGAGTGLPPDSKVLTFGLDYKWKTASDPIFDPTNAVDPLVYDAIENIGVGLGRYFADEIRKTHPDWRIGLVPCAKRESLIDTFFPDSSRSSFYGSGLNRARQASRIGQIAGILFYHGESAGEWPDANDPHATTYGQKFKYVVDSFRDNIGNRNIPLVYCQIWGDGGGSQPAWGTVKAQQAAAGITKSSMFVTDNVDPTLHNTDNHWFTAGYDVIGRGMAKQWMNMVVDLHPVHHS